MAPRMCWLGTGDTGKAMAQSLAERGNLSEPLIVWNRTFEDALSLHRAVENTVVADSLETAVAQADMVWSCVSDDDSMTSLFERILGLCGDDELVRGKVFVECTTVRPSTADAVAASVLSRGGEYVAMPPIGDAATARAGGLVVTPAGARASVDKVMPFLSGVMAKTVVDYGGEEPGKAPLVKLVGGMAVVGIVESVAEAHVLADKTGLGADRVEQFLDSIVPGPHTLYSRRFNSGAYYRSMIGAGRLPSSSLSSSSSPAAVAGGSQGRGLSRARFQRRSRKQQQRCVNKKRCCAPGASLSQPTMSVHMALRVAKLVKEMATATGTALPAYEIATRLMGEVTREEGVSMDIGGMYGVLRKASGLPYVNQ